ncbi:Polyphosphate kinase [Gracilaria domingensis]|nr:Polyphosphate kinase [Gracilaria domingensis]
MPQSTAFSARAQAAFESSPVSDANGAVLAHNFSDWTLANTPLSSPASGLVAVRAKGNDAEAVFAALSASHQSPQPHLTSQNSSSSLNLQQTRNAVQPVVRHPSAEVLSPSVHGNDLNSKAIVTTPDGHSYESIICPFDERVHYAPHSELSSLGAKELAQSDIIFSKEFAELSMMCRVLSMAMDPFVPLLDRFKFLCIVSSSLDEHFSKRLGSIPKLDLNDLKTATINLRRHVRPKTRYEEDLTAALRTIMEKQSECLTTELLPQLAERGVQIVPHDRLTAEQKGNMTAYFKQNLRPALTPTIIDATHPFPLIQSHDIYIYVRLFNPKNGSKRIVLFRCPSKNRLIPIDDTGLKFITSEDVCLANLNLVCHSMTIMNAYPFRVTRNTKISIEDESLSDMTDLLDFIVDEVHRRRQAPATRLEVMSDAPSQMIDLLVNKLCLDELDVYVVDTPYLDLSSCMSLAFVPLPWLRQVIRDPVVPSAFKGLQNRLIAHPGAIFGVIGKEDVLVEYPRDNFENSAVLFLHAAARDPKVRSIKSVLYRGGENSPIVAALIRAAKNGKEVSVIIELKASFDEIQNSEYARALQVAGCNVTYGMMGLKVHSKIMLVVREESHGNLCSYCSISTGNFNPKTAKLYTDYCLFTCDKDICTDVLDVFNHLTGYSENTDFRCLLVSPVNMQDRFIELIREEAKNAREGRPARIACQMNGLSDKKITEELYEASRAGVKIDLLVRAACRIRPGIKGLSENINVYSWFGQVLQHRRVYYFHAGGEGKYFIGSADWRTRNLVGRVEVIVPIKDAYLRKRLSKAFELIDDAKWIWRMAPDGHYYKGFPASTSPPVSVSIAPRPKDVFKSKSKKSEIRSSDSDGDERSHELLDFVPTPDGSAVIESDTVEDSIREASDVRDSMPRFEIPVEGKKSPKRGRSRPRYIINIKGNTKTVDKIAVGVVPIRFVSAHGDVDGIQVLMVAREPDDPWAVPKGGQNEGETQIGATIRIAREKAGVSSYEVLANLGWIEVDKGQKHAAFQTVVLLAKELGTTVGRNRRRKWMPIREALEYSIGEHRHEFTAKALERAIVAVRSWGEGNRDDSSVHSGTHGVSSIHSGSSTPAPSVVNGSASPMVETLVNKYEKQEEGRDA